MTINNLFGFSIYNLCSAKQRNQLCLGNTSHSASRKSCDSTYVEINVQYITKFTA